MPESDTLLASLVSSFPGNTENIATEALSHILATSDASLEALNDVVRSGVRDVTPVVKVSTQVTHPDGTNLTWLGLTRTAPNVCLLKSSSGRTSRPTNRIVTSTDCPKTGQLS